MSSARHSLLLASLVLLAGNTSNCNLSGPAHAPGLSHAVSTFACGPADGPATQILLARDAIAGVQAFPPYVSVMIQRSANQLAGTTWTAGTSDAGAIYRPGGDAHEEAELGTIRIDAVVPQERVRGRVELRFPSRTVTQSFDAPWVEGFVLCG